MIKRLFTDLSIKKKLILISLFTTGAVLFLTEVALIVKEIIDFRHSVVNNLTAQAKIVGMNSTAALLFNDQKDAGETLSAFKTTPNIMRAILFTEDGKEFSKYKRYDTKTEFTPLLPQKDEYSFGIDHLSVFHRIILDNKPIGTLFIQSDLEELYRRITWHVGFAVAIMVVSLFCAFLLLSKLQKVITKPILELVQVMGIVSKNKNYSLRTPVHSHDEMGSLANGFNEMLSQIQNRDTKLKQYSEHLKDLVTERTAELQKELTERKRVEEALRVEKNFIDSTINSLSGIFYMFDVNGRFLKWNRNLEVITGYSTEEISRMHPLDFFDEEEKKLVGKAIQEVFVEGEASVEANLISKDGRKIPYFFTGKLFISGYQKYLVGMGIDVSELKQAEEEIRKLNVELEKRVLQRTAQLEAANKELESFSYSVSHDLRAPLRAIDGFSRILFEDYVEKFDDEGKRLVNIIRGNTKKMSNLIDDLLALSRIGRKDIDHTDIDMERLAGLVFDEIKATIPERKLQLNVKPLPSASGDAGTIRQVFVNLLTNAIKFTRLRETPIIEVGGYIEDSENVYYVKDNGVGFDMQYADKLFGTFQRLHSDKEFEGTGIGLALVQRVINRHGGRIWAEGKVNEGATFYFTLPKVGVGFLSKL